MLRAYQPGENQFRTKSVRQITGVTEAEKDDNLPTIINVATGLVLPDVEIVEQRKFVDYYTFQAYDVVKDVEAELDKQVEDREENDPEYHDSRNGYKPKTLRSSMGEIPIQVPQDRNSDFEPQVVPKYKKDISEIEGKIIAMYARGMSVAQVSEQIKDIYGFEVSEGMVTAITNKLLPEIEAWQKRPLSSVYPIVYIDAIVFNMRENNVIRKAAAYVILGLNEEGRKEVLSITIGENESA